MRNKYPLIPRPGHARASERPGAQLSSSENAVFRSIRHAARRYDVPPSRGYAGRSGPHVRPDSMDCLLHRLRRRLLGVPEPESPRYRRQRTVRGDSQASVASDTSSYYSASSNFIDRVILGKHIYIRSTCEPEPDFSESDFVMDCLHWHNLFREKHGVPPLALNNQLCCMAQFWANHLAHTNTFSHRNIRDIGENLFSKWSYIPDFDITGQQVTKYWYDEIKTYNFFQHPDLLHVKAGHFTQLVWRSTRDLGVGKARSRCGKVIVVANYRPIGNVAGQFHVNVLPPMNDADLFRDM